MVDLFPVPKGNKKKFKSNIQPNNIVGANRGDYGVAKPKGVNPLVRNITGSDNLFSKLQEKNPEVRNRRGARTLFNMLGTFGTERNEKIIRMNLQLLRNTLVETFEIAKLLRVNAAQGAMGTGGGGGGTGGGLALLAAGAAGAGAGVAVGSNLNNNNDDNTEEGDNKEEDDDGITTEQFIKEQDQEFDNEFPKIKEYKEKELNSDLDKSSKGLIKTITDGFGELIKGLKIGTNLKDNTNDDENTKEDKIQNDATQYVEDKVSKNENTDTLVEGVKNSFKENLKQRIGELESNNDYGAMYSRDREGFERGDEDITKMSISEVDKLQTDYLNYQKSIGREEGNRSAAMGAYQMLDVKKVAELMGLDPDKTIFDKETQDKMVEYYLNYAGLKEFEAGDISAEEFNNRLAEQFASVQTTGGVGVYDDDNMNKAKQNLLQILQPAESKFKELDLNSFIPGNKKGEFIVLNNGANNISNVGGGNKTSIMVNGNTGKSVNQGPTLAFRDPINPDSSDILARSVNGIVG